MTSDFFIDDTGTGTGADLSNLIPAILNGKWVHLFTSGKIKYSNLLNSGFKFTYVVWWNMYKKQCMLWFLVRWSRVIETIIMVQMVGKLDVSFK